MSQLAAAPPPAPSPPSVPVWVRLAAVPIVAAVMLAGGWYLAAEVAPGLTSSVVLVGTWFAGVFVAAELTGRRLPSLRGVLRGTVVATAAAAAIAGGYTSLVDTEVHEAVAVGTPASRAPAGGDPVGNVEVLQGAFSSLAHGTSGRAAVVRLADGRRVLTLTGLDTDPGPDLRVLLVAGEVDGDGDVDEYLDLGALKGNVGDQGYAIPQGADLGRHATVVIWCRAFSSAFGKAPLAAS